MTLPSLAHWETTRESLQRAALAMSTVAKKGRPQDDKFFHHLTLQPVSSDALTTGETDYGVFTLNLANATLAYQAKDDVKTIPLDATQTQKSVTETLMKWVTANGHTPDVDLSGVMDEMPLSIDAKQAHNYGIVLHSIYQSLHKACATLSDGKTKLVVFPHHFDLSMMWFNGDIKTEHDPHVMFGFSPGDGSIDQPYLYTYGWDGEAYISLPAQAPLSQDDNWTSGLVIHYSDLQADPESTIQAAVTHIQGCTSDLWT